MTGSVLVTPHTVIPNALQISATVKQGNSKLTSKFKPLDKLFDPIAPTPRIPMDREESSLSRLLAKCVLSLRQDN